MRASAWLPCIFGLVLLAGCPSDDGGDTEAGDTGETSDVADDADDGVCEAAPGTYGDCVNGSVDACMDSDASALCVTDDPSTPSLGVCARDCDEACECWEGPASGTAPVACKALVDALPNQRSCVLDCSGGETCPDGMNCLAPLDICVFQKN